jgi:hypothetical protein
MSSICMKGVTLSATEVGHETTGRAVELCLHEDRCENCLCFSPSSIGLQGEKLDKFIARADGLSEVKWVAGGSQGLQIAVDVTRRSFERVTEYLGDQFVKILRNLGINVTSTPALVAA